jgi:hypothetical protein
MIKVALLLVLAAGAFAGIRASGDGSANRQAFLADVAHRLDIALPRPQPRPAAPPRDRLDTRTLRYRGRSLSIDATAQYLGITQGEVREELRIGGSLADVARTHGGTVDGLQQAIEAEVSRRLQGLTDEERLRLAARLDDILRRDGRPAGWSGRIGP